MSYPILFPFVHNISDLQAGVLIEFRFSQLRVCDNEFCIAALSFVYTHKESPFAQHYTESLPSVGGIFSVAP
jgi:hypothetical protein